MKETLYIPDDLKVGFCLRKDTYTGKLGFVIYKDGKGKWRQEKSWEEWRSKPGSPKWSSGKYWDSQSQEWIEDISVYGDEVKEIPFKNEEIEGFVVNKDAGGVHSGWGWNDRLEKVRIYDPRGFEIEITIPNLLYILQERNSYKGKGLEGKFIYAWDKKNLVLLPVGSKEHNLSNKFSSLQDRKFSLRDLKEGYDYLTKDQETVFYLGRDILIQGSFPYAKMKHIFWNYKGEVFEDVSNHVKKEVGKNNNNLDIIDIFKSTNNGIKVKEIQEIKEISPNERRGYDYQRGGYIHQGFYFIKSGDYYNFYRNYFSQKKHLGTFSLINGTLKKTKDQGPEVPFEAFSFKIVLENGYVIFDAENNWEANEKIRKENKVK